MCQAIAAAFCKLFLPEMCSTWNVQIAETAVLFESVSYNDLNVCKWFIYRRLKVCNTHGITRNYRYLLLLFPDEAIDSCYICNLPVNGKRKQFVNWQIAMFNNVSAEFTKTILDFCKRGSATGIPGGAEHQIHRGASEWCATISQPRKLLSDAGWRAPVAQTIWNLFGWLLPAFWSAHAEMRDWHSISLLQAILFKQYTHGLSSQGNIVSLKFYC